MSRISSRCWRRWCAPAGRGPTRASRTVPGGVFVLRTDLDLRRRRAPSCWRWRAWCCVAGAAASSDQLDRREVAARVAPPLGAVPRRGWREAVAAAAGGLACATILQRSRRLLTRRTGIRYRSRTGPVDARRRGSTSISQSGVRLPGGRRRRWLHLVAEQPRQPAHARGRTIRSSTGRARRSTCAISRAATCGRRPRSRSASTQATYIARHGFGYSRFERDGQRHRARAAAVRAARRPDQDLAAHLRNISGIGPRRLSVTAYVEWVLGPSRGASRRRSSPRRRDGETGAMLRPQPVEHAISASRVAFADLARPPDRLDRRPQGVHRPQRQRRQPGRARGPACRSRGGVGAGLDPCAALQTAIDACPGETHRGRLPPRARRPSCRRRARWSRATARPISMRVHRGVVAFWDDRARHRAGEDPGPRHGHHAQWLAALPDAGLPLSGRGPAFYQASGAYGFRDQLQDGMALAAGHGRRWRAATSCAPPAASSSRATSSIGGSRSPARACAPASPTISAWLAVRRRTYVETTGDTRDPRRAGAVPRGPAATAGRARSLLPARPCRRERHAVRALRARPRSQPRDRRARPAADGHRRLERRHEPGRRGRPGRERLARLVPATPPDRAVRAAGRVRGEAAPRRCLAAPRPRRCSARWSATAGTAPGIAARFFDDGTPLGSAASEECRIDSIAQSWAVLSGAAEPRRAAMAMEAHGAPASIHRGDRARASCSRRRSTRRRSIPATSRAIRPACARTAASTPTPPCGRCMAFATLGEGDKAARALRPAQPDQPRAHAGRGAALQGRALCRGGRRLLRCRRMSGAAAGPGTPARPAGSTVLASSRSSACALEGDWLVIDSAQRRHGRVSEMKLRYRGAIYEIAIAQSAGAAAASSMPSSTVSTPAPVDVPACGSHRAVRRRRLP